MGKDGADKSPVCGLIVNQIVDPLPELADVNNYVTSGITPMGVHGGMEGRHFCAIFDFNNLQIYVGN